MVRFVVASLLMLGLVGFVAPTAKAEDITFDQAFAIAQRQVPDGTLIRARVEGASVFGFYFWQRPRVVEVEIMKNGTLKKRVKSGEGDEEVSQDVLDMMLKMTRGRTKLPDGRILEIAGKQLKDTPISGMRYAIRDERLVAVVGDLIIDAQTGKTTTAPKAK